MPFQTDSAAINNVNFPNNYFYSIGSSSETGTASSGSPNTYSGTASAFSASSLSGQITVIDATAGTFSLNGNTYQIHGTTADGNNLIFGSAGGGFGGVGTPSYVLSNSGTIPTGTLSYSSANPYNTPNPACFCEGTLISTPFGKRLIETLRAGDVVKTTKGEMPIKWIGFRSLNCRASPWPEAVLPIEIAAHAFGPDRPSAPLSVSPNHSLAFEIVDHVLVPAHLLVNGSTVIQKSVDRVDYWHIELEEHAIIIANDVLAESYIDTGNRGEFSGERGVVNLLPRLEEQCATWCGPKVTEGPVLDAIRAQLLRRANALGWSVVSEAPSFFLEANGKRINPALAEGVARFDIPSGSTRLVLHSDTFVPAHFGSTDRRILGLQIKAMLLSDGLIFNRSVNLSDPILREGFSFVELKNGSTFRWTNGQADIPASLWADSHDAFFLRIEFDPASRPTWHRHQDGSTNALAA